MHTCMHTNVPGWQEVSGQVRSQAVKDATEEIKGGWGEDEVVKRVALGLTSKWRVIIINNMAGVTTGAYFLVNVCVCACVWLSRLHSEAQIPPNTE